MPITIKKFFVSHIWRIIKPFRKIYWFFTRPVRRGVHVIIEHNRKFLLVKNTYGTSWTFSGGFIKTHETPRAAAKREVKEEVNIEIKTMIKLGRYEKYFKYHYDKIYYFYAKIKKKDFKIDPVEIEKANWFPLTKFPKPISAGVIRAFKMYKDNKKIKKPRVIHKLDILKK